MKNGSQSNRICMHHVSPIKPWRQFTERHPHFLHGQKPQFGTPIIAHLVISSIIYTIYLANLKKLTLCEFSRQNKTILIFGVQFSISSGEEDFEIIVRREHNSLMVLLFQDAKHPRCVGDLEVLLRSMSFTLFFSRQIMMIAFHPSRQLFHIRRPTSKAS